MRYLIIALCILALVGVIPGCSSGAGSTGETAWSGGLETGGGEDAGGGEQPVAKNGFSEHDFANNPDGRLQVDSPAVRVLPHNVAATFLEPEDATSTNLPDTLTIGVDLIPITIPVAETFTYSMDPNDVMIDSTVMLNASGQEVFRLNTRNPTVSIYLQAGDYDLVITAGHTVEEANGADHRVVFLYPDVSQDDRYSQSDLNQLLSTNSCPGGDLGYADLDKAELYGADLEGANLYGASLEYADLTGVNLENAYLTEAILDNAFLHNGNLKGTEMHHTSLVGAYAVKVDLTKADMWEADLTDAELDEAILHGAVMNEVNMTRTELINATLTGINFFEASAPHAILSWSDLSGSNLSNVNLQHATMEGVNLTGTRMSNTNLEYADLLSAAGVTNDYLFQNCMLFETTMPDGSVVSNQNSP